MKVTFPILLLLTISICSGKNAAEIALDDARRLAAQGKFEEALEKPCALNTHAETPGRTIEIVLQPGRYYFVGNETGWERQAQPSYGVIHRLRFQIDDGATKDKYLLRIELQRIEDPTYYFHVKFIVKVLDQELRTDHPRVWTSFEDSLSTRESIRPLTNKPYIEYEESKQPKIFQYQTLQVDEYPYVKINNWSRSLIIASAETVEELSEFIRIPKTFVFYEWRFPFVLQ